MGWLSLLFSGWLEKLLKWGSAAIEWLFSDWQNIPLVIALGGLIFVQSCTIPALKKDRDDNLAGWIAERNAHAGTVDNYVAAAVEAQRIAEANVARVEAEQVKINQETTNALETRLGALRARYDQLVRVRTERGGTAVDPGSADAAGLPASGDTASGAAASPSADELPSAAPDPRCPAELVCLTFEEALRASEDAVRHDELIDWVWKQGTVSFTPQEVAK